MSEEAAQYRRNVAAVIVRPDGCVLLGRKKLDSKHYHFPQGGVGRKETFEEALWREIDEETGLQNSGMRIVARFGGLRYHYRRKNRKSKQWLGQEQTFFLIFCESESSQLDCSKSPEFGVLEWVPYQILHPDMFVSFKREVVAEVLNVFFPCDMKDLQSHVATLNILQRYQYGESLTLSSFSAEDRSMFAGGKSEAVAQMADLHERISVAQRALSLTNPTKRILVLIHDAQQSEPKRRINCLRRVAALFDPILTRVARPEKVLEQYEQGRVLVPVLMQQYPAAGETLLTASSAYLLPECDLESIEAFEKMMHDDDVLVLKFFLHITAEQWERYAQQHKGGCYADYTRDFDAMLSESSEIEPWHIVPSEKKWYRDYVIASIVASSLEKLVLPV